MEFINSAWCISTEGFVSEAVGISFSFWRWDRPSLGCRWLWPMGSGLAWGWLWWPAWACCGLANQNRPLSARIRIDADTQMKRFRAFQQILSIAPMALPMNLGSVSIHSAGITP